MKRLVVVMMLLLACVIGCKTITYTPIDKSFLITTGDIPEAYSVVGMIHTTYRGLAIALGFDTHMTSQALAEDVREALENDIKKKAIELGADGVINVEYVAVKGGCIIGWKTIAARGTAIKRKK